MAHILHVTRLWRAGDEGQGIRVGVISGGAKNFRVLARNRILPNDVVRFGQGRGRGDEGDWMLQVVHDIAPRAQLAFCPGGAPRQTVACAKRLIDCFHAAIVVDDINPQPVFFVPTAKARGYARLLQRHLQVLFFTGAGNNGGGYCQGTWRPQAVCMGARRLDAQTFGASGRPYDRLWVSPGAQAVVLLGTDGSAAHPGGCSSTGGPTRLIVTDRAGRMLAETLSECPLMHVRLRNNGARVAHWRVYVLRRHRSWLGGAMKLVASRTGLGVSPLWLSDHTQGWAGSSATSPGLMAVAAVDPGSGDHGRYLPEAYANGGPQCWHLGGATAGRPSGIARGCIRQPVFAAPDRTQVAMPAGNARGYRDKPFTGDSAASPAAAGAAALLLAKRVAPQEIESLLEHTARPQGAVVGWTSPRERTPRTVFVLRERVMNRGADQPLFIAACGGDEAAARRLRRHARAGDPIAQSLLGTLCNRGWGLAPDPRAAHA